MSEMAPLVSVVIPTYYRDESLRDAIKSVQCQTHSPIEIIVIDDSGERYAEQITQDFDVEYIAHQENRGPGAARNTGVEYSTGQFIQFLDDDDQLHPEKIEKQVDFLTENSDIGVCYCGIETTEPIVPDRPPCADFLPYIISLNAYPCCVCSLLIERSSLNAILPLQRRRNNEDHVMMFELAKETEFGYIDEALVSLDVESHNRRSKDHRRVDDLRTLLTKYEPFYEDYPDCIRDSAYEELSGYYFTTGRRILDENVWSVLAIRAFFIGVSIRPELNFGVVCLSLCSFLGRPGMLLFDQVAGVER